jgi:hypothetical protein
MEFSDVQKRMETEIVATLTGCGYAHTGSCSTFYEEGYIGLSLGFDVDRPPSEKYVTDRIGDAVKFVKDNGHSRQFWLGFSYWQKSYEGRGTIKVFTVTVKTR